METLARPDGSGRRGAPEGAGPLREPRHVAAHGMIRMLEKEGGFGGMEGVTGGLEYLVVELI